MTPTGTPTPGPRWHSSRDEVTGYEQIREVVAGHIHGPVVATLQPSHRQYAALIAVAPSMREENRELREALRQVETLLHERWGENPQRFDALATIRAALAKVKA